MINNRHIDLYIFLVGCRLLLATGSTAGGADFGSDTTPVLCPEGVESHALVADAPVDAGFRLDSLSFMQFHITPLP